MKMIRHDRVGIHRYRKAFGQLQDARPDLASLLDGLKLIQDKDYPIRGTLVP